MYTPITPVEGGLVHATSLSSPHHTACGRVWRAWKITTQALNCQSCQDALTNAGMGGKKGKGKGKGKRKR